MEAAGLAVGVAGLAGLFSCCIDTFQLIQKGRSFGRDYKILETKFSNQQLRLRAWGRACGLIDGTKFDDRLDGPELKEAVTATLECIKLLLGDAKKLKERYGLRLCTPNIDAQSNATLTINRSAPRRRSELILERTGSLNRFLARRSRSLRESSALRLVTALWVIDDRTKFGDLVKDLKDLIDDLEDLTRATEIPRRQLIFVEYEIESISDTETLEEIEEARDGDDDVVSDAASARLERLSQGTASIRSSIRSSQVGSFITLESYFTARTHFSRTSSTAGSERFSLAPAVQELGMSSQSVSAASRAKAKPAKYTLSGYEIKPKYKCLAVGDPEARKVDLLTVFVEGSLSTRYRPSVFENHVITRSINGRKTDIALWDISGQEDESNSRLRALSYPDTAVVIICFLLAPALDYYDRLEKKWVPEVSHFCRSAGIILAGIEPEMYQARGDEQKWGEWLAKKIGAWKYVQCNVDTGQGVDEVLEAAIMAAVVSRDPGRSASLRPSFISKLPWRQGEYLKLEIINE